MSEHWGGKEIGIIFLIGVIITLFLGTTIGGYQNSKSVHAVQKPESSEPYSYQKNVNDINPDSYSKNKAKQGATNDVEPDEDLDGSADEDNGDY